MHGTIVGRLRLGAPVVLAALFACAVARSGDPLPNAFSPIEQSAKRTLLLSTGRVVEGRVSSAQGGYLVELPNGNVLIPTEHVMFEADNLPAVYHKLRESFPTQTAARHVNLASWCLNNGLEVEARRELVAALEREPDHEQARSMLRKLQVGVSGVPLGDDEKRHGTSSDSLFPTAEAESLAGLSRESAQQFVLKVQPILMNKCGFSRCHGTAAKNEFRLTHVRTGAGSHRVFAERNLAAVVKYIDVDAPETSKLLSVAKDNHGRGGRAVFYGNRGAEQFETLQQWVQSVGQERRQALTAEKAKPSLASIPAQSPLSNPLSRAEPFAADHIAPPRDAEPSFTQRTTSPGSPEYAAPVTLRPGYDLNEPSRRPSEDAATRADDERLRTLLRQERPDAFDPDEFNRAVHGRTAREIKFLPKPAPAQSTSAPAR